MGESCSHLMPRQRTAFILAAALAATVLHLRAGAVLFHLRAVFGTGTVGALFAVFTRALFTGALGATATALRGFRTCATVHGLAASSFFSEHTVFKGAVRTYSRTCIGCFFRRRTAFGATQTLKIIRSGSSGYDKSQSKNDNYSVLFQAVSHSITSLCRL